MCRRRPKFAGWQLDYYSQNRVHTQLRATADPNVALAEGVWHVPDFGMPGDRDLPMIVAAHRYGWKWWWKDDYWKYHSSISYQTPAGRPD